MLQKWDEWAGGNTWLWLAVAVNVLAVVLNVISGNWFFVVMNTVCIILLLSIKGTYK